MTDIYIKISELTDKFREMCYGISNDENRINEAVQELMLYFLQMNPDTLKRIYQKDGKQGILKYGAVVLKRALTSPRSPFYYKYEKYYTNIVDINTGSRNSVTQLDYSCDSNYYKTLSNMPNKTETNQWEKLEQIDLVLDELNWYDRELFKLYYYEGNTLDGLAAKTRISRNSIFSTIDKVRDILKKELND
ncbi:MAG: hypothetical protein Unbinned3065contig1007_15 [Prokaryotic dsDNA virus sp.]|nr:MAG: hypothetical protein Unbinned3065contig1007_15 [Prokaryotic dsDNA virus sp.]|tara:strand:- start:9764 stop:10336 length:573 start_codon:yes stop_codon:yes gene_type:complete